MAQSKGRRSGPTGTTQEPAARESVAAGRLTKPGSNRTQVTLGSIAIVVIAAIIVFSIVLNRHNTNPPVSDYPNSTASVATVDGAAILVTAGSAPVTVDLYQDMLCPACQDFERQFGQQINQLVDQGKVAVRYHLLNFLDPHSASKDYSTRAAAALMCVAADPTTPKGSFLQYMQHLYAKGIQPTENGSGDLNNAQLAAEAAKYKLSAAATACISSGQQVPAAKADAAAAQADLQKATGQVQTPTGLKDGSTLDLNNIGWLSSLVEAD